MSTIDTFEVKPSPMLFMDTAAQLPRDGGGACNKGGLHEWRTDGMHFNVFCGKCFVSRP